MQNLMRPGRTMSIALVLASCAGHGAAPTAAPVESAPVAGLTAADECEAVDSGAGWHASAAELDQAMRTVAGDAASVCDEVLPEGYRDAVVKFGAAIPACGAKVPGDRRLGLCIGDVGCCRMRATSAEVEGRRFIVVRFPDIGDFTAHVFELGTGGPTALCSWVPYMTSECRDDLEATVLSGCAAMDAAWPQYSQPLKDYLCSGGEPR